MFRPTPNIGGKGLAYSNDYSNTSRRTQTLGNISHIHWLIDCICESVPRKPASDKSALNGRSQDTRPRHSHGGAPPTSSRVMCGDAHDTAALSVRCMCDHLVYSRRLDVFGWTLGSRGHSLTPLAWVRGEQIALYWLGYVGNVYSPSDTLSPPPGFS